MTMKRYKIKIEYLPFELKLNSTKIVLPDRIVEAESRHKAIYLYFRYFKVIECSFKDFTSRKGPKIIGRVDCEEIKIEIRNADK